MLTTKLIKIANDCIDIHSVTSKDIKLLYMLLSDKENCYYQYDLPINSMQAAENIARLSESNWNKYGFKPENSEFMFITCVNVKEGQQPLNVIWLSFNRDITVVTLRWVCNKYFKEDMRMRASISMLIDYYVRRYKTITNVKGTCDGRNRVAKSILEDLGFSLERVSGKDLIFDRKFIMIG